MSQDHRKTYWWEEEVIEEEVPDEDIVEEEIPDEDPDAGPVIRPFPTARREDLVLRAIRSLFRS